MTAPSGDLPPAAEHALRDLAYAYDDLADPATIRALYSDSYARLAATAKVSTFLPTLAAKLTRQRLHAKAQAEGREGRPVPEVLFLCVRNAGRSQIAAAWARHYAGPHLHIRTAGSRPDAEIHTNVREAMAEVGIALDEEFPKPLTDEVLAAADVVITMGCGDECPYLPGRRVEDWPVNDPAIAGPVEVAAIRDDIRDRVRVLLDSLHIDTPKITQEKS